MKDDMLAFMDERFLCVISTVGTNAKPESAMVAYVHDGLDLFIGTSKKSRKFQNILNNASVAIVIADTKGEVQYEGQVRVLNTADLSDNDEINAAKLPGFEKYRNDPDQTYLHITPTWVRFIDHGEVDKAEEWSNF